MATTSASPVLASSRWSASPWVLWCILLASSGLAMVPAHWSRGLLGPLSPLWVVATINAVWFTVPLLLPRDRRPQAFAVTTLAAVAVALVVPLALGEPLGAAARFSVGSAVHPLVTVLLYHRLIGGVHIAPQTGRDLLVWLVSGAAGASVALLPGVFPGVDFTSPPPEVVVWLIVATSYSFAAAPVLILVHRTATDDSTDSRLREVYLQLVLTGLLVALIAMSPGTPLYWTLLIPAIWAGSTLGPWVAAAFVSTVGATIALLTATPQFTETSLTWQVPHTALLLASATTFILVGFLTALMREQRTVLMRELLRQGHEVEDRMRLLKLVFDNMSEGVIMLDSSYHIELVNLAARRLTPARILVDDPAAWRSFLEDAEVPSQLSAQRVVGADDTYVVRLAPQEGRERRSLMVTAQPIWAGGQRKIVLVVRDITTEQQRLAELTSFAAVAAHDLKSPLVAIRGWLELAEDALDRDHAQVETALVRARTSTERMTREIDDWLSFNVSREGIMQPGVVSLGELLDDIVATYAAAQFRVHTPHAVRADRTLTTQLLVNLIGNAVKYTPPDRTPVVEITTAAPHPDWVKVEVRDEGIGIRHGEEGTIFQPFHRSDDVSQSYEGSGLGLALCQRIVLRHGGEITARRNEDRGTTVSFTLPAAP